MLFPFFKLRRSQEVENGLTEAVEDSKEDQSKFDLVLQSVRRLLRRGAITHLGNLVGRLHSADVARVMGHLSSAQDKCTVFELVLGDSERGKVLSELNEETIQEILEDRTPSEVAWLLRNLGTDDVAYILSVLPEEQTQEILPRLKEEESQEVAHILTYPKGTAGNIMTTEFFLLPEDIMAQEAIQRVQQATKAETVFYIYGTDKEGHLTGVLSLRELLTVAPTAPLKALLTREPISVTVDTQHKEVAQKVANYNLLAIPVLESDRRLVGIITVDDVIDVIQEEDTKEMLKMAGAVEEDSIRRRRGFDSPWFKFGSGRASTSLVVHEPPRKFGVWFDTLVFSFHHPGGCRHCHFYPSHCGNGGQCGTPIIDADHSWVGNGPCGNQ